MFSFFGWGSKRKEKSFDELTFSEQLKTLNYDEDKVPAAFCCKINLAPLNEPLPVSATFGNAIEANLINQCQEIPTGLFRNCYKNPLRGYPIILFTNQNEKEWIKLKKELMKLLQEKMSVNKIEYSDLLKINDMDVLEKANDRINLELDNLWKNSDCNSSTPEKAKYEREREIISATILQYSIDAIEFNLQREKNSLELKEYMNTFIKLYKSIYELKQELKEEKQQFKKLMLELTLTCKKDGIDSNKIADLIKIQTEQHNQETKLPIKISLRAALFNFIEFTKQVSEIKERDFILSNINEEYSNIDIELSQLKCAQLNFNLFGNWNNKSILNSPMPIPQSLLPNFNYT